MKKPDSLPWKKSTSYYLEDCIEGSDDYIIAERFGDAEEQEYCIKACNDFPKAIELLKLCSDTSGYPKINNKIKEFLNRLENE